MAITRFEVERYRSYGQRTAIALHPLNVAFGYNSAGKSALVRVLPLIAASAGGAAYGPLALDADVAREATWDDFRTRQADRNELCLRVAWDDAGPAQQIEWRLRGEGAGHVLDRMLAFDGEGRTVLDVMRSADEDGAYTLKTDRDAEATATVLLDFDGLRPDPIVRWTLDAPMEVIERAVEVVAACSRLTASLKRSVHWLGAVRRAPARRMPMRGAPKQLSGDGWWAWDMLAADGGERAIERAVAADLGRMFPHHLRIEREGTDFRVVLTPQEGAPVPVSVLDVGEGVAQVIPVLTMLALAERGDLGEGAVLALEQPEMHLHPRAELLLAEVILRVARSPFRPRLLVETHSENLLRFLQLAAARGDVDPGGVSILWLTQEQGQTRVLPLPLDARGRIEGWPPGVFSEDLELSRKLLSARRSR